MERAPTPAPTNSSHETSDTPIYDQLMQDFMSTPDVSSFDQIKQQIEEKSLDSDLNQIEPGETLDSINALDKNLSFATGQTNKESSQSTTENQVDALSLTAKESATKVKLEGIKKLSSAINESLLAPVKDRAGNRADQLRDLKDKGTKKALMLDRRESALQRDAARLEAKLAGMNPNSMRYRRLNKKMGMKYIKLGETRNRISGYNGKIEGRSSERDRINRSREVDNQVARDMLIVAKKVASAKKERRKLQKEVRRAITPDYRAKKVAELEKHITEVGPINKLQERLIKDVVRRAERAHKLEG